MTKLCHAILLKIIQLETMRMPAPQTTVAIMYENSIVHVEKEELAYPMSSLIADCGGIMGLFVGFNFIMIWKLLISFIKKIVIT